MLVVMQMNVQQAVLIWKPIIPGIALVVAAHLMVVNLHLVKIKDYGIVVMDSVSQHPMYVMDQVNFVMDHGVLTVPMVQMKA